MRVPSSPMPHAARSLAVSLFAGASSGWTTKIAVTAMAITAMAKMYRMAYARALISAFASPDRARRRSSGMSAIGPNGRPMRASMISRAVVVAVILSIWTS